MKNIIIVVILILILFIINISSENMNNNSPLVSIKNKEKYGMKEIIEITTLPFCRKNINIVYGNNYNFITNDSKSIGQDILDPHAHTIEIDGKNYNLIKVIFKRSRLSWQNKNIGLELHLIHNNYESNKNVSFIIPLDLVNTPTKNIETFRNVFYNTMDSTIKTANELIDGTQNFVNSIHDNQNLISDINLVKETILKEINKFNLNLKYNKRYDVNSISVNNLLNNINVIPEYKCCGTTYGPEINFNLCNLETILNNMVIFHNLEEDNGNSNLVTEPVPFSEEIGLHIRNILTDDNDVVYIK
uniref:Alpha-carbonic anhydrase domain-containing protein n=1 Tax=viral metagenome TaxID=1070528 RepID=A0A6C0D846_9ZZZZ